MIYIDGYSIEQYPNRNCIEIALPPTAKTAFSTLLGARYRRETLSNDELTTVLMMIREMMEGEGDE